MAIEKFEVGLKVRVVKPSGVVNDRSYSGPHSTNAWIGDMDRHIGKEFTITSFDTAGARAFGYGWIEDWLELVEDSNEATQPKAKTWRF